jgi:hypothetical protein
LPSAYVVEQARHLGSIGVDERVGDAAHVVTPPALDLGRANDGGAPEEAFRLGCREVVGARRVRHGGARDGHPGDEGEDGDSHAPRRLRSGRGARKLRSLEASIDVGVSVSMCERRSTHPSTTPV